MSDEKKEYTIKGKVEIGTDEYRDLIEKNIILDHEVCEIRSARWKAEREKEEINKKLKEKCSEIDLLINFLELNDLSIKFKQYKFDVKCCRSEEDEV